MKKNIKMEKGVGGLNILLSVIVMIFVIGILIMTFVLTGTKIGESNAAYDLSAGSSSHVNESHVMSNDGFYLNDYSLRNVVCTLTLVKNHSNAVTITSGNYTQNNCFLNATATSIFKTATWNVTYTSVYDVSNGVGTTINDTSNSLADVVDWFPIIITITAVVVLILLIVLIIVSLRGAGMMGGNMGGA